MRRLPLACALAGIAAVLVSPAASAPTRPCGQGDATALGEVLPVAFMIWGRGEGRPRLAEAFDRCQYRLFFDGATFTFSEDDVILGGIVHFWDYPAVGMTRSEAIASIDAVEDRVWIDGVEQTLSRTVYKDFVHPLFGKIVYQHRYFTMTLPAGSHVSHYESNDPVFGPFSATVHLEILPSS